VVGIAATDTGRDEATGAVVVEKTGVVLPTGGAIAWEGIAWGVASVGAAFTRAGGKLRLRSTGLVVLADNSADSVTP
jgi:hypothetical protein